MNHFSAYKFLIIIWSLSVLSACKSTAPVSTAPVSSAPYKVAVSDDIEIVWVAGMRGLQPELGLAGSCPTPEFFAHEIPNDLGVGFGVCFIPKIKGVHASLGILYTITLPGEGAINPETKDISIDKDLSFDLITEDLNPPS